MLRNFIIGRLYIFKECCEDDSPTTVQIDLSARTILMEKDPDLYKKCVEKSTVYEKIAEQIMDDDTSIESLSKEQLLDILEVLNFAKHVTDEEVIHEIAINYVLEYLKSSRHFI